LSILSNLLSGFGEIGGSFIHNHSIWWVLAPIFILWITLEVYFGEFKKEKLGWNTSLANGITLLWIIIDSVRHLFNSKTDSIGWRVFILIIILAYAGFIVYISFTHKLSAKLTYIFAAPTPIYFLCMVAVLWSYGALKLGLWVIIDLIILFSLVTLVFYIIKKLLPEADKDSEEDSSSDFSSPTETGSTGMGSNSDFRNKLDF
jgi:hypothetical protein